MITTLAQVLNRTEKIENEQEYKVIEQNGIGGKPTIVAGGENLRRFNLPVKLHANFCNPAEIIAEIEEKAQSRKLINYFQSGKYIGDFVIEKFHKNIVQTFQNAIFYAEIEISLVEDPESITEFEEQTITNPEILQDDFEDTTNVIHELDKNIKNILNENMFSQAFDFNGLTDLSNFGKTTLNAYATEILREIKSAGITQAQEITDKWTEKLIPTNTFNGEEFFKIKTALSEIPNVMLDVALRTK